MTRTRILAVAAMVLALVAPTAAAAAVPSNDNRGNAEAISSLPFSDTVDVADATTQDGEPAGCVSERSVWYRHVAKTDGRLVASTAGTDFDNAISVYEGSLAAMSHVKCEGTQDPDRPAVLDFNVVEGRTYFFQVGTYEYGYGEPDPGHTVKFGLRQQPDVKVALDEDGWVKNSTGDATATGTAACSATVPVQVRVQIQQVVPGGTAYADNVAFLTCGDGLRWQLEVQPSRDFIAGRATATVAVSAPSEEIAYSFEQKIRLVRCTKIGTVGADTMNGTSGADRLCTLSGNDTISSGGGGDLIYAAAGADAINTGGGDDRVFAGEGTDTIAAGRGNDTVSGGDSGDLLELGAGKDTGRGGEGRDRLRGQGGGDALYGEENPDAIDGGDGSDNCVGGTGADSFRACERKEQ